MKTKLKKRVSDTQVVLLGSGGNLSLSVTRALAAEGVQNIHEFVVDPVPVELSKNSRHMRSYTTYAEGYDELKSSTLIDTYRTDRKQAVLLPVTVQAIAWCDRFQRELHHDFTLPPLPEIAQLDEVIDKWNLHQWLIQNDFESPAAVMFHEDDGIMKTRMEKMEFPVILKSKSEIPFKIIHNIPSAEQFPVIRTELANRPEDNFLQQRIPGIDRECSLVADRGKLIAYTMQSPDIPLDDKNIRYATSIKVYDDQKFLSVIRRLIEKLQWSGVAHLDFRYNPNTEKYYLIDFNPRYWATLLGSVCAGVNIPYLQMQQALGISPAQIQLTPLQFKMNRDAIKEIYSKIFDRRNRSKDFRIKNSEFWFMMKDPLPELLRRFGRNAA